MAECGITTEPRTARAGARRRVTMTDVARAAGCSQATVSCVLNANFSVQISEPTRERVLRVARELGYEAPILAGLAPSPGPGAIAFVIDSLVSSPEGVVALDGVRQAVRPHGYVVLAAETQNDPELEPRTLGLLLDHGLRGLIYACLFTRRVVLPPLVAATSTPVALLNCYTEPAGDLPAVVPGEFDGGRHATELLIAAGHRRIATITGEPFMEAARDRLDGYRTALACAGIAFDPALVVEGDWSASAGYRATSALLGVEPAPTAIFCQNDRMAVGCFEALKESGRRVPADMSVVGYDDDEIARHLFPPLTALVLPHRAMGCWAVERMLRPAASPGPHPVTRLECGLVVRESVGPPRR